MDNVVEALIKSKFNNDYNKCLDYYAKHGFVDLEGIDAITWQHYLCYNPSFLNTYVRATVATGVFCTIQADKYPPFHGFMFDEISKLKKRYKDVELTLESITEEAAKKVEKNFYKYITQMYLPEVREEMEKLDNLEKEIKRNEYYSTRIKYAKQLADIVQHWSEERKIHPDKKSVLHEKYKKDFVDTMVKFGDYTKSLEKEASQYAVDLRQNEPTQNPIVLYEVIDALYESNSALDSYVDTNEVDLARMIERAVQFDKVKIRPSLELEKLENKFRVGFANRESKTVEKLNPDNNPKNK